MNLNLLRFPVILLSLLGLVACSPAPSAKTTSQETSELMKTAQSVTASGDAKAADAYYQQLLGQYGQDCSQCLKALEFDLKQGKQPTEPSIEQSESRSLNVVVVLDASESMAETVNSQVKMELAKRAIARLVNQLPKSSKVSLLVYGYKGSTQAAGKPVSCSEIETVYPMSSLNSQQFQRAMNAVRPKGYAPIAAALLRANSVFTNFDRQSQRNLIYLVSNSVETCGGDPVGAAQQLQASHANAIVNVIGLDVDNGTQRQLQAVANAGSGEFISVRSAKDFDQALDRLQRMVVLSQYGFTPTQNPPSENSASKPTLSNFKFCVTQKLSNERFEITKALSDARFRKESNAIYADYVEEQLQNRHEGIGAWRDRVIQDLEAQRDLTFEQIQKDLNDVLQQSDRTLTTQK